ncbi:MAG: PilN domain-containing protein [Methylococcaceae bacterium]
MLNINSTIDIDFKSFFRWWRRELSFLVPEKIKQLVNDKQGFVVVTPENGRLTLTFAHKGQSSHLAVIDRNESGIAQYKALQVRDERLAKTNIILRLTGIDAIHTELSLPVAARQNLYQVVGYELDKYTPFKADQVYFSVKLLAGPNEPGHIRAMLVLTTREFLDALYEDVRAMGMSPLFADYEGAPNDLEDADDYYNLLPEWLRQKTAKTSRLVYSALLASAFLLLLTVFILPVWLEYEAVNELEQKVKTIEKDAKKIKALQSEIDASVNETQKLIDQKTALPPVVEMLNELSALIKDDTWLAYTQYSDNHLQIQGESPAASALISVLEASELFANARFVSPVTQDNVSKLERFQITVDVTKPGGDGGNRQ